MTGTPTDKKLSERVKTCVEEFNNARAKNLSNTGGKGVEWVESRRFDDCAGLLIDNADAILSALRLAESHPSAGAFKLGDFVQKKSGSSWRGKIVGFYATDMTPRGYCVESAYEPGSVQIYPETALVEWKPELSHPSAIREAVERELEDRSELARRIVDNCGIDWNGHDMALIVQRIVEVLRDGFDVRARGEENGNV